MSWYLYNLYYQAQALKAEADKLVKQTQPLSRENQQLLAEIGRLEDPENLEIELRKAGYAAPGEKVIILVPKKQP